MNVPVLDDLEPAKKIEAPKDFRPGVEFDGSSGIATTEGLVEAPNFDDFLRERGYSPDEYEIVGTPRTSQWQRWDGEWLTAYRFHFHKKNLSIDLPTLYAQAKRTKVPNKNSNKKPTNKAFVIAPADWQIGKTGSRGGTKELLKRIFESFDRIETQLKKENYQRIVIIDMGDIIESVSNSVDQAQLESNDLSPMQQVDLASSLMWDLLKLCAKYAPVQYGSVASNHCQWRHNKQSVGKPGRDDWGIVILQQLRRLATEVGLNVQFFVPHPEDEGFALDVFDDGFHILGAIHGHQARRPDQVPTFWRQQTFGSQYLSAVTMLITGHFHHVRLQELGAAPNGGSRWWLQASTSDSGSDWFRRITGEDSQTGITCFELEKEQHFTGTIMRA